MTDQTVPPLIAPLGAVERGCLLFADITGYTKFIDATEITHAQDVIGDLIETMLTTITPTFQVSRVEGDAVFAFADGTRLTPAMVLDTVDSTYFQFRKRLRDVVHATTCPCQACRRIPQLDLKFFLHDGEYSVKQVAGFTELSGMEVIVLHRLAKGSAKQVTDGNAFAVYTKAILDEMAIDPDDLGLIHNVEEFEDTGPIDTYVQDMESRWQSEESRNVLLVEPGEAIWSHQIDFAAPPQVVWDYLTDPVKRVLWQSGVTAVLSQTPGRPQTGSVNHCMHGPDATIEHIADWRPFRHLSLRYTLGPISDWLWSYVLEPTRDGTRFTCLITDPGDGMWDVVGGDISENVTGGGAAFKQVVDEAWATEQG